VHSVILSDGLEQNIKCIAAKAPRANKSESPGKAGVTVRPVSQKITKKIITYARIPKPWIFTGKYLSK
jgi:hypothetical protein